MEDGEMPPLLPAAAVGVVAPGCVPGSAPGPSAAAEQGRASSPPTGREGGGGHGGGGAQEGGGGKEGGMAFGLRITGRGMTVSHVDVEAKRRAAASHVIPADALPVAEVCARRLVALRRQGRGSLPRPSLPALRALHSRERPCSPGLLSTRSVRRRPWLAPAHPPPSSSLSPPPLHPRARFAASPSLCCLAVAALPRHSNRPTAGCCSASTRPTRRPWPTPPSPRRRECTARPSGAAGRSSSPLPPRWEVAAAVMGPTANVAARAMRERVHG